MNLQKSYQLRSGISVISAADAHPNRHEGSERAAALHHRLPNSTHQLSTPHADPEQNTLLKQFNSFSAKIPVNEYVVL